MDRPHSEDCANEYQKALELAATSRYREAREKLRGILGEQPDFTEALILLGKVEYYLRRSASSRLCFETALIYEPDNSAAWCGLQFYRERRRVVIFGAVAASLLLSTILTALVVYLGLGAQFDKRLARELATLKAAITLRLTDLAEAEERNVARMERLGQNVDDWFDRISSDMQANAAAIESSGLSSKDNAVAFEKHFNELAAAQEVNRTNLGRLEQMIERLSARLTDEERSSKLLVVPSSFFDMIELEVDRPGD